MDLPPPIPESEPSTAASRPPATSVAARMLNVFATPGAVFEEVKTASASVANWLVPIVVYGLVTAVASVLILSQPVFVQKMRDQQEKVFEAQVKAGKMTREQADKAMETVEKFSGPIAKVGGAIGGFSMGFVAVFWWAFLMWLIGRSILKARLDFMKVVEVAGLASLISALESLIRMLLVFGLNNPLASPSLGLLMKDPDPKDSLFALLSVVNIMTFWVLVVRSIGLARLAGVPLGRTVVWLLGAWAIQTSLLIALSAVAQKAYGG
jgi:hypothetical protein